MRWTWEAIRLRERQRELVKVDEERNVKDMERKSLLKRSKERGKF